MWFSVIYKNNEEEVKLKAESSERNIQMKLAFEITFNNSNLEFRRKLWKRNMNLLKKIVVEHSFNAREILQCSKRFFNNKFHAMLGPEWTLFLHFSI